MKIDQDILTGKTTKHLAPYEDGGFLIHRDALSDFQKLFEAAHEAGFDLAVCSSYRSYDQQLAIWNAKARGERPLLNSKGDPLEYSVLTPKELIHCILRWSALPGFSRHHWGTDLDVYDRSCMPSPDYKVQLTPQECAMDGPFGEFHDWLDDQIITGKSFGFYRPYAHDLGGVSPERWHLSYAPIADLYLHELNFDLFAEIIRESDMELLDFVLKEAKEIYENYVVNITRPSFD